MPRFIRAGNVWINLDLVTTVELVESPKKPGELIAARVYYSSGKSQDFTDAASVRALREFVESHEAG